MDPEAPFLQVQVPFHQVLVSFHHIQGPSLAQVPFHAWRPEVVDQVRERTRHTHETGLVEMGVVQGMSRMTSDLSGHRTQNHWGRGHPTLIEIKGAG